MRLEFKPMASYLWNPTQWQGSRKVQRMGWAERGLYREILDECYLHGSVPTSPEALAEMLGEDLEVIAPLWARVARCLEVDPEDPSRMVSPFIETVRSEQNSTRRVRAAAGKAGNDKRYGHPSISEEEPPICEPEPPICEPGSPLATDLLASAREEGRKEGVRDKETSTPISSPAPVPAPPAPARDRKPRKTRTIPPVPPPADSLLPYSPEVVETVNGIVAACPYQDVQGRSIRVDGPTLTLRIDRLLTAHPRCDGPKFVQCWVDYLATNPYGIKSPSAFFGDEKDNPGQANWLPYMRVVMHRAAQPPPPTPPPAPDPAPDDVAS